MSANPHDRPIAMRVSLHVSEVNPHPHVPEWKYTNYPCPESACVVITMPDGAQFQIRPNGHGLTINSLSPPGVKEELGEETWKKLRGIRVCQREEDVVTLTAL